jgi:transcriptional regulator with XRE-family HTH domain
MARERVGLELSGVARVSGLTVGELTRIEAGHGDASIAVLQRLASAVGESLIEVIRRSRAGGLKADGGVPARPSGVEDLARAVVALPPSVGSKIDAVASAAVLHAMAVCHDNQSAASRLLGMERKAFVRRLQRARRRRK